MKTLVLAVLAIFMFSTLAMAAPFLVCDPQAGVTKYRITGDEVLAELDGSVKWDIISLPIGEYNGTIEAGWEYMLDNIPQGIWNWSDPVPFILSIPGVGLPGGLGLEK